MRDGEHVMAVKPIEHERLDKTVLESPKLLACIVGSVMDAIIAIDDAQRIMLLNVAAEKMFGCPADQAIGNSIESFIPQRFRTEYSTHVRRFFDSGMTNRAMGTLGTLWGLRSNGDEFPIEASISMVDSGGTKFFAVIIRDITERQRAEEARIRNAAIVECSDDAIAGLDMNGTITDWNKGAERLFGYSASEAIGQNILFLSPADARDDAEGVLKKVWQGEVVRHHETVRRRKDGTRVDISLTVSPIVDSQGRIIGSSGIAREITERKRAEQALRASEERLRLAQQAARIGTFEWNIQTGVNTWTPELEEMYGLPAGGFGGTQTAFENLVHPDDRAEVIELVEAALKTGQPTKGEWRVVWSDGSVHWISGRWQVFMNDSSKPSRMVGINIDITERKRAEEALRVSEERLHLAIEAGSVGGWDYNLKTGKKVWFGETHAQLGMAPDEPPGSFEDSWDRIHKDDREHLQQTLRVARDRHEQFTEEFRVVWRDGTTRWVRSRGRFFYAANGEPERLLGLSVDITERKLAEEKLRTSEERLRLAQWAARIGTFDLDLRTGVDVWTPETEALYGLPPGGFGGTLSAFENLVHPDDRGKIIELSKELIRTGRPAEAEWRVAWADGSVHWIAARSQVLMDESGEPSRMLGVNMDITDRKQMEEALSEMSRKLIESQEQERARIGRELHDDINQRLAMLGVELEQLQENPSEVQSRVPELRNQMTELSNDVQAMSHDLHSSKLEYLGVVAGIKSWCKEFGERQKMQIDFRSEVSSVLPLGVGLSLFRVLQEALNNAIKHSGVKRVEVRLREDSGEIHLVIGDLGRGFDVEAASKGKGLGLTSMRERVRLVNGTISIESKPMGGTTIHVRVPLGSEHAAKQEAV
jgi:PAS domain S-box-containing protein